MVTRLLRRLAEMPVVVGFLCGLLLCSLLGRLASHHAAFQDFRRIFPMIAPESSFNPTLSALVETVRSVAPRDRIPVIIGGHSVFRGVGQNVDELWTSELQRLLGDRYAVVNLAMNGANFSSFAAVAFRVLQADYPRILYVAGTAPLDPGDIDGQWIYRYVFWDGFYKARYAVSEIEARLIGEKIRADLMTKAGLEMHLGQMLDGLMYFNDLWNYVGYHYLFTVWTDLSSGSMFQRRNAYVDPVLALDQIRADGFANAEFIAENLELMRAFSRQGFSWEAGRLVPIEAVWAPVPERFRQILSDDLRRRAAVVLNFECAAMLAMLSPEEQESYVAVMDGAAALIESAGYRVAVVGRDFVEADCFDRIHLSASGGRAMAALLSPVVEDLARENGFLP